MRQDDVDYITAALAKFKSNIDFLLPAKVAPFDPDDGGVPPDMQEGPIDSEGWVRWRILPSAVTETDVESIEEEFGVRFPCFFRAYLVSCLHLIDQVNNDRHFLMLPSTPSDNPLGSIRQILTVWQPVIRAQLVPFGEYQDGAGPLLFDTLTDNEPSVVWIDHEIFASVGQDVAGDRNSISEHIRPLYSSFRELFEDQFVKHPKIVSA